MSARLGLLAQLSLRMDAIPAHRLIREYRAEVLHETPLFLAEYDGAESEVHLTLDDARAMCDDVAGVDAMGRGWDWHENEHGIHVQFWTHEDDDRPLHMTGGTVTEIRVQRPEGEQQKDTGDGESTPADVTVYRASHDSIVMGLYTTREAAREHCETLMHREQPDADLNWYTDPTEGYEDAPEDLFMVIAGGESDTGYAVTPLEVASEYDAEADE